MEFTHFDNEGRSRMVDVSSKDVTVRIAIASGKITMNAETLKAITDMKIKKGNVFEVARIAGIMATKQTQYLIPLCHPININSVGIEFDIDENSSTIKATATVNVSAKTGVEMEALTAVSITLLTIYDMCKAVDRAMVISDIKLMKKSGGKSGEFVRHE